MLPNKFRKGLGDGNVELVSVLIMTDRQRVSCKQRRDKVLRANNNHIINGVSVRSGAATDAASVAFVATATVLFVYLLSMLSTFQMMHTIKKHIYYQPGGARDKIVFVRFELTI